jgi:hypothetical protein
MALYLVGYDLMNHKTQGEYEELMKRTETAGSAKSSAITMGLAE